MANLKTWVVTVEDMNRNLATKDGNGIVIHPVIVRDIRRAATRSEAMDGFVWTVVDIIAGYVNRPVDEVWRDYLKLGSKLYRVTAHNVASVSAPGHDGMRPDERKAFKEARKAARKAARDAKKAAQEASKTQASKTQNVAPDGREYVIPDGASNNSHKSTRKAHKVA